MAISYTFRSKIGWLVAGAYLLLAAGLFLTHLISVKTNPADSGESAIPFFLLTWPWGMLLPQALVYSPIWHYLAYPAAWLLIIFNSLLLYCPFGLRISRKTHAT